MKSMFKSQPTTTMASLIIGIAVGFCLQPSRTESEHSHIRTVYQPYESNIARWKINSAAIAEGNGPIMVPGADRQGGVPISPEEWAASNDLYRRMKNGEYILKWENPIAEKLLRNFFTNAVNQISSTNAAGYDLAFEKLGIKGKEREQLQVHLAKIYRASLEAEGGLQQLLLAQLDFDKRMQSLLTEDQYLAYREYEELKLVQYEYSHFRKFLESRAAAIPDAGSDLEGMIFSIIRENRAYTDISWQGPYGGIPQIAIGDHQCSNIFHQQVERIEENMQAVDAQAAKMGLPGDYRLLLRDYYDAQIQSKRKNFERLMIEGPEMRHSRMMAAKKQAEQN